VLRISRRLGCAGASVRHAPGVCPPSGETHWRFAQEGCTVASQRGWRRCCLSFAKRLRVERGERPGELIEAAADEGHGVLVAQVAGQHRPRGQVLEILGEHLAPAAAPLVVLDATEETFPDGVGAIHPPGAAALCGGQVDVVSPQGGGVGVEGAQRPGYERAVCKGLAVASLAHLYPGRPPAHRAVLRRGHPRPSHGHGGPLKALAPLAHALRHGCRRSSHASEGFEACAVFFPPPPRIARTPAPPLPARREPPTGRRPTRHGPAPGPPAAPRPAPRSPRPAAGKRGPPLSPSGPRSVRTPVQARAREPRPPQTPRAHQPQRGQCSTAV
jgi:hypothetical protein